MCIHSDKLLKINEASVEDKKHLKMTLNSIGDAIITTDPDGNIISMNRVAEKLTGWNEQNAINQPIENVYNIINATTRESLDNPIEKVLKTGKIIGLANHTVLISKNGNEYQIADSGSPIKDKNDRVAGVALVFRDVTEKYRIRESLRKSEEIYKTVFENTGAATIIIEEDTTISLVNKKFEDLTGYSKNEAENKMSWMDFVQGEDLKKMKSYHRKRRDSNKNVPNRYEATIFDRKGEKHNIIAIVSMIPETEKSVASFLDITVLKKAREKNQEAK